MTPIEPPPAHRVTETGGAWLLVGEAVLEIPLIVLQTDVDPPSEVAVV